MDLIHARRLKYFHLQNLTMNRSEETDDQIESQQLMDEEEFVDAELGQPRGGAPTHGQTPMQFQLTLFAHCFYIIMCMCSFTVVLPSMWAYIIHVCFSLVLP